MEILGAGLFCLSLFGWSFIALRFFNANRIPSIFIGVQLLILGLYLAALIQALLFGTYLIEVLGLAAFIKGIYHYRNSKLLLSVFKKSYYLIPFLAFTFTIPRDFRFTMSDEFPSWAANIKTMYSENRLGGIHSATRGIADGFYQSYPPFQQLFQYLFLRNTSWSESNVQIAQNILILSTLLGASAFIFESNRKLIFPTWIGAISLYFLFGFTMGNLLADGLLAAQFAACLSFAISNRGRLIDYLLLGLLIANLILIKPTGFIFALCALALAFSILGTSSIAPAPNTGPISRILGFCKKWRELGLISLIPAATYITWQLHLRLIKIAPGVGHFSLANLGTREIRMRWVHTWNSYKSNFFGSLYGKDNLAGISSTAPRVVQILHVSLFMIFLVLTFLQLSLAFAEKKEIRAMEIKNALLFSALAIFYQVFLLFLYMFFFGNYEGVRSAALVRYSGSFFLGWTIFVLAQFIRKISLYNHSTFGISIISVSLILLAPSILFSEVGGRYTDLEKLPARLDVEKLIPKSLENLHKNSKVYYIYQGSNGFEKYIYSYLVLPIKTNWSCPSLGKPYFVGDVWTCDLSLPKAVKGYDYLAVGKGDLKFWSENSKYLAQGSMPLTQGLYKITESVVGVQLKEVQ
jgi:hypothetical protein